MNEFDDDLPLSEWMKIYGDLSSDNIPFKEWAQEINMGTRYCSNESRMYFVNIDGQVETEGSRDNNIGKTNKETV